MQNVLPDTRSTQLVPHGNFGGFIDMNGTAVCTDCRLEKTNSHFTFYKNRVNPTTKLCLYTNKKCHDCIKLYNIHKKQSEKEIKDKNIERIVPTPENPYPCDNCNKPVTTSRTIQLDHCHKTGCFRGWICKECNISLGNLGDNIEGMFRTVHYLNKTYKYTKTELIQMLSDILDK